MHTCFDAQLDQKILDGIYYSIVAKELGWLQKNDNLTKVT